jgi:hypothetical protein
MVSGTANVRLGTNDSGSVNDIRFALPGDGRTVFAREVASKTAPALECSAVFVALGNGWIGRGDLARIELPASFLEVSEHGRHER